MNGLTCHEMMSLSS